MKEIELIFLPGCPYCVKAKQAVKELQAESESYAGLPLKWINEQEETGYADTHDYYYVPTVYWNDRKFFEAAPGDSLEKIKAGIRTAFDAADFRGRDHLLARTAETPGERPTAYSRGVSVNPLPRCCQAP